jgi:Family of unknown function (DUF5677)
MWIQRTIADMSSPFEDMVASIDKTPVVPEAIAAFTDSEDHFELSFNLLRETTQLAVILGGISIGERPGWNRNQAVVGGHLVRLTKLLRSFMDEVNDRREEIAWVVLRMTAECIINLRYLLANYSDELVDSFVYQSLQHERDLLETIAANVAAREAPFSTSKLECGGQSNAHLQRRRSPSTPFPKSASVIGAIRICSIRQPRSTWARAT